MSSSLYLPIGMACPSMGKVQFCDPSSSLHSRYSECGRGPTQLSRQGDGDNVVFSPSSYLKCLSDLGNPGSRFVSSEQETTVVLLSPSCSESVAGRCVFCSLGQSGCQHFSPNQHDLHGHQSTDDILVSQKNSDHSMLATSQTVPGSAESTSRLPKGDLCGKPFFANLRQEGVI